MMPALIGRDSLIYTMEDCESAQLLRTVTRGVYLMQSGSERTLFRFGQIGAGRNPSARPADTNNAAQRLRQCAATWRIDSEDGTAGAPERFHFVFLAHMPSASKSQIKAMEAALRAAFRSCENVQLPYANNLTVRRWNDKHERLASARDSFSSAASIMPDALAALAMETVAVEAAKLGL